MKSLKECIQAAMATPMNTPGMGNPQFPSDTSLGSEPLPLNYKKHKKKNKKLTKRLNKIN